jgi:hypothetical protein
MDEMRTIHRILDPEQQSREAVQYWRSRRWASGSPPYGISAKLRIRLPYPSTKCKPMLPKDLKDLLLAFNEQHVRYLIFL